MAEIAGLVLGGIPMVIWALDKYSESLQGVWKYEDSVLSLRNQLWVQRQALQVTLSGNGLNELSSEELEQCLAARFPNKQRECSSIIERMHTIVKSLLEILGVDENGQVSQEPRDIVGG